MSLGEWTRLVIRMRSEIAVKSLCWGSADAVIAAVVAECYVMMNTEVIDNKEKVGLP